MPGVERLHEAFAEYLRLSEAGTPTDLDEIAQKYSLDPAALHKLVESHARVKSMVQSLRDSKSGALPRRFGKYELVKELGRGGMGVVYKAVHLGLNKEVALKMILAGKVASARDVERFREEAQAIAELEHPNIVPIHDFGEEDGQQYFSMKLVEGGNLQERLASYRDDPRGAVRLVVTLAGAIQVAHQHGIIHRDLKPGNVLLDADSNPHITDFGLAKRMDGGRDLTTAGFIIGTLAYMAPEQIWDERLSTAVDVYGLGALLYALLTGRAPFESEKMVETYRMVQEEEPADPGSLNPRVDPELAAICLKCLEKNPARRYESAKVLADDLENWLEGKPVRARPLGRFARCLRWSRRHKVAALVGALVGAAAILLVLWFHEIRLGDARQTARRQEILESNVYTARFVSRAILARMQDWGAKVEMLSRSGDLASFLSRWNESVKKHPPSETGDAQARPEARLLQGVLDNSPPEPLFVNWQILDALGSMIARRPPRGIGGNFRDRDYFKGTLTHAGRAGLGAVHVSSVYRSQVDGLDKFDICAPVVAGGVSIGAVSVAVTTDPTLGVPSIQDERRKVVLVGPRDPSYPRPEQRASEYVVLLHPALTFGQEALPFDKNMFPSGFPKDCDRELTIPDPRPNAQLWRNDYVDPYGARNAGYGGFWLAGFAPVGHTGFVVILQQRRD